LYGHIVAASTAGVGCASLSCENRQESKPKSHALDKTLNFGTAKDLPIVPAKRDVGDIEGYINYMSHNVPTGLYAKRVYPPAVGVYRDKVGNDVEVFGIEVERIKTKIKNGHNQGLTLDKHACQLVQSPFLDIDFYNVQDVTTKYYADCCELVKKTLGARAVYAFDHNLRSPGNKGKDAGFGFQVQPPLQLVHSDYTEESARRRIRDLTKLPTKNDIQYKIDSSRPLIPEDPDELLGRRFMIVNVWRNIHPEPVERNPVAFLAPHSVPNDDVIIHEIHFGDRVGENYNARHGNEHEWWYFPAVNRDEAVLLKTWDSAGEFCRWPSPGKRVPATFSFHSAVEVGVREDAPDRQSIEVRCMVLF